MRIRLCRRSLRTGGPDIGSCKPDDPQVVDSAEVEADGGSSQLPGHGAGDVLRPILVVDELLTLDPPVLAYTLATMPVASANSSNCLRRPGLT